jgi:hypothetical protein
VAEPIAPPPGPPPYSAGTGARTAALGRSPEGPTMGSSWWRLVLRAVLLGAMVLGALVVLRVGGVSELSPLPSAEQVVATASSVGEGIARR